MNDSKPLHETLDLVCDKDSFLLFVEALLNDKIENRDNGWENTTVENFLQSALRWAEDSNFGESQNVGDNVWKKIAVFLYCGKIYE